MKQIIHNTRTGLFSLLAAIMLVVAPTTTFVIVGCSSVSTSKQAYTTLYAVGSSANTAVDTWIRYYLLKTYNVSKSGQTNRLNDLLKQDQQVKKLYSDFQSAYNLALTTAQLNVTNPAPESVTQLSVELTALVIQLTSKN